jgi:hypothetical protein
MPDGKSAFSRIRSVSNFVEIPGWKTGTCLALKNLTKSLMDVLEELRVE